MPLNIQQGLAVSKSAWLVQDLCHFLVDLCCLPCVRILVKSYEIGLTPPPPARLVCDLSANHNTPVVHHLWSLITNFVGLITSGIMGLCLLVGLTSRSALAALHDSGPCNDIKPMCASKTASKCYNVHCVANLSHHPPLEAPGLLPAA